MIIFDAGKNRRGFVLLFAVILTSILLAMALGAGNIALKEINFTTSARESNDAFFAADTAAECALFHDKLVGTAFPKTGQPTVILSCTGAKPSGSNGSFSFTVKGLGSQGRACAIVDVIKKTKLDGSIDTTIESRGYNLGGESGSNCDSTSSRLFERAILISSSEPLAQTVGLITWDELTKTPDFPTETGSSGAWTGSGNSIQSIDSATGGYVEFFIGEEKIAKKIGLGESNIQSNDTTRMSFGFYIGYDGFVKVGGESSFSIPDVGPTDYHIGDSFKVSIESGEVKYYKNGILIHTTNPGSLAPTYYANAFLYECPTSTCTTGTTVSVSSPGAKIAYASPFTVQKYKATVVSVGDPGSGTVKFGSTICPTDYNGYICYRDYNDGSTVTFTAAVLSSGYQFTGWSGDAEECSDSSLTCTLKIDYNKTIVGTFSSTLQIDYELNVAKAGLGSGKVTASDASIDCGSLCQAIFNNGSSVILTATPDPGSVFTGWSGSCTGTSTTCSLSKMVH